MTQHNIKINTKIATSIRERRIALKLTVEEAAKRAGIGTKTWYRYEAGEAIRKDKYRGVCKALNWSNIPKDNQTSKFDLSEYTNDEYWSKDLNERFGQTAAMSFIIGSEILEDFINQDIEELSKMPKDSHIGQLDISFLSSELPQQFLPYYNYDFLFQMRHTLLSLKARIKSGTPLIAHSVMEELTLYIIVEESKCLIEENNYEPEDGWDNWIFDIFDDMDIITCLYSPPYYVTEDNIYHFKHWMEPQFYTDL